MKLFLALIGFIICVTALKNKHNLQPRRLIKPIDEQPNDINSFSWKVFQGSKPVNPVDNLVLSPISIQFLLALMEFAAEGETKRQLQLITGFKQIESLRSIYDDVVSRQASHLETSAAVFVTSDRPINKTFTEKAHKTGTDVFHIGLNQNPEDIINQWIAKSTKGKIRNTVNQLQSINPEIVLTSAIYFQGKWLHKFTPSSSDIFYTFVGTGNQAEYMELTDNLLYEEFTLGKHTHGSVIGIPFDVPNSFLFIVLPGQNVTLDTLIQNVNPATFNRFYNEADGKQREQIKLIMPKFQVTSYFSVVNPLLKMGLVDLFTSSSNLPYMVHNEQLQISDIIQQSYLSIDEDGATAASATISYVVPLSARDSVRNLKTVKVNKPFLAVIVDNGVPIFVSKIYQPYKI
ncbi:SRPN11 family protein [Megaselia abdita]